LKEYVEAALVAVILALFAKAFVFEAFAIPSGSMEDGLLVGDHVLVDKLVYAPHRGPWRRLLPYREVARGDVIVFRGGEDPGQDFIKDPRVLGTDGVPAGLRGRDDFGPFAVPGGTVFALGDNRDDSRDSRFTGPVPLASVKGRALLVYWSYQEPERAFTGRGASLRKALSTAVHFFTGTRWERSFRVIR